MNFSRLLRGPAGLIGMLAMISGIELYVARHQERFMTHQASAWKNVSRGFGDAAGCEVVAMGDSLVKHGVVSPVVERKLGHGRRAYNLALPGGSAPADYFLLRRMLSRGIKPRVILVDGELLGVDPLSRAGVWPAFLNVRELAEMSLAVRDADYFLRTGLELLLPTFRARAEIRQSVIAAPDGKFFEEYRSIVVLWRNWKRNGGSQVLPQRDDLAGPDPRTAELQQSNYAPGRWECAPLNALYMNRFLNLAARNGIDVVWLLPPVHPEVLARRIRGGWASSHEDFVKGLQTKYHRLTIVSGWKANYPPAALADVTHLSRTGAIAYSDALGDYLRRKLDGENPSRIVDLPRYDRSAAEALAAASTVEDDHESGRILNRMNDQRQARLKGPTRR